MAEHMLNNAYFSMGGVDLSDHVISITVDTSAESLDNTVMGDTTRSHMGGLKDWTITVTLQQDYAAGKTDHTVEANDIGATCALIVKPIGGTTAATNPKWTGTGLLTSYTPITGTVGDFHAVELTFVSAGALTRAESD